MRVLYRQEIGACPERGVRYSGSMPEALLVAVFYLAREAGSVSLGES